MERTTVREARTTVRRTRTSVRRTRTTCPEGPDECSEGPDPWSATAGDVPAGFGHDRRSGIGLGESAAWAIPCMTEPRVGAGSGIRVVVGRGIPEPPYHLGVVRVSGPHGWRVRCRRAGVRSGEILFQFRVSEIAGVSLLRESPWARREDGACPSRDCGMTDEPRSPGSFLEQPQGTQVFLRPTSSLAPCGTREPLAANHRRFPRHETSV